MKKETKQNLAVVAIVTVVGVSCYALGIDAAKDSVARGLEKMCEANPKLEEELLKSILEVKKK